MARLIPPRLVEGDRVAVVSPASTPDPAAVEQCLATLRGWGLRPELGPHALDRRGYLAGSDADRLADLNAALRDPGVRAIIATRGGKGSYRIADGLDLAAAGARDPKLVVGFSDITVLLLKLARDADLVTLHGLMASWDEAHVGEAAIDRLRRALTSDENVTVTTDPRTPTASLTRGTAVSGPLYGGNQDAIATAAGWALPSLEGAIVLLEGFNLRLGHIDRQLTMLRNAGHLDGIVGVAVGHYTACGPEATEPAEWSAIDVLGEHLDRWDVPVLGGLPIGHGPDPWSVPIGTVARLDPEAGTLVVGAAVR